MLEITKQNEKELDRKMEAQLNGHRLPPNGRNLLAFRMRWLDNPSYRGKFDRTFRGSPSSKEWFDSQFCPFCDRRISACVCGTEFDRQEQPRFMAPRGVIRG